MLMVLCFGFLVMIIKSIPINIEIIRVEAEKSEPSKKQT